MTLIVGIEDGGKAYIGADSFLGNSHHAYRVGTSKVFRRGPLLIAICGSMRFGAILRYKLKIPARNGEKSDEEYMAATVADAIRDCMKEHGYATKDKEREAAGYAIIGYKGRVYQLQSEYDITPAGNGWLADGAGENIAIGALAATEGMPARKRMQRVLGAAAQYSPWVSRPFKVMSV